MIDDQVILLTFSQVGDPLSWWQTIQRGGVVAYIILGMSVVALGLVIMHFVQIRRRALLPVRHVSALDELLASGDVSGALRYCLDPQNDSYMTRILASGLTRFQKSAFGAFEIKNALEEAGEDQTARLYRSTDALGVIGHIAPLLGLLGTVIGMVGAFDALGQTAGDNHEQLAAHISLALVTTLMGLILAIPAIALYTFFKNRIDAFASECALEIERLVLHLESMTTTMRPGGPAPRDASVGPTSGTAPANRPPAARDQVST